MTGIPSPLDVQELLGAQDFVHRLARGLLFDQQRVDDAVQEAWLAAVRRPPRERAAVGAWFHRVLDNVARRRSRDDRRRREREARAARPEALPSADEVLQREQQRREVVDAVMALPEPYRGAVLARFYDGLEPGEIARRRGTPAATVRSQLHRALEMLRARLDERHGSRRAWGLLLVPLARPRAATGAGLLSMAGALLMVKILVGVGALALAVLGLLWSGGGAAPPRLSERAQVEAPVANVAPSASTPTTVVDRQPVAGASSPTAAGAASPTGGLRGRLVFENGDPAGGRLVRVLGIDGVALFADAEARGRERTLPLPAAESRSAVDGTFVVAGLAPCAQYAIHADADGPDRTLRLAHATPAAGEPTDIGDVVLCRKGAIVGRAVDEDGVPVANAEVLAIDLPAALVAALPFDRLDPRFGGMLTVPVPTTAGLADLEQQRDGLRDYLASQLFERADLDRDQRLATFVVDRLPWFDAIWRELPIARTRTGADGAFVLVGAEPGLDMLVVRKPGLASGILNSVTVRAAERRDVGDVVVPAGEELRGVVRDAAGDPVVNAEVRVAGIGALGHRGLAFCEAPVRSGAGGVFVVRGLARGRVYVAGRRDDGGPWAVHGPVASDDDVEVVLPAPVPMRLRVVRSDEAPVDDLAIELFEGPCLFELRRAGLQQRLAVPTGIEPGRDGIVDLGAFPPGVYTLQIRARGTMPAVATIALPQAEPRTVALASAHAVVVRVVDAGGVPVRGAKVYVGLDDPALRNALPTSYGLPHWSSLPLLAGVTDAEGRLAPVDCPPATTQICAIHADYGPARVMVEPSAAVAELVMPALGSIDGALFDHGRPADPRAWSIHVEASTTSGVPLPELRAGVRPDGTFALPKVAPGSYDLRAEPIDAAPLSLHHLVDEVADLVMPQFLRQRPVEHEVEVAPGEATTISFDVDPARPAPGQLGASMSGRVSIDGVPLRGAMLEREVDWFRQIELARVGDDGTFQVANTAPGEQRIRLRMPDAPYGVNVWEGKITLRAGENRFVDLALRTGVLRGSAFFASGRTVAGSVVTAAAEFAGGRIERTAAVDPSGAWEFLQLPAGRYRIFASGPEGKSGEAPAEVVAGGEAPRVRVELKEFTVLSGRIVGDVGDRAMIFLKREGSMTGMGLEAGGAFHFADLEPVVHELSLHVGGDQVRIEPHTFDLREGSRRDVEVRIVPVADSGK